MEDGGGHIGWVWGWSGVGWLLVAAKSATLSKRENKIGVSRTSSILSGSRTRSVLGGSVLGGDDLDGGTDELLVATMGAILPVLRCDLNGAIGDAILAVLQAAQSRQCFRRRDLIGARVRRDRRNLGLGVV